MSGIDLPRPALKRQNKTCRRASKRNVVVLEVRLAASTLAGGAGYGRFRAFAHIAATAGTGAGAAAGTQKLETFAMHLQRGTLFAVLFPTFELKAALDKHGTA